MIASEFCLDLRTDAYGSSVDRLLREVRTDGLTSGLEYMSSKFRSELDTPLIASVCVCDWCAA